MENKATRSLCIKKADLFDIWRKECTKKGKFDAVLKYVIGKIEVNILSDEIEKHISQILHFFCVKLATKWEKSHRNINTFKKQNEAWLNTETNFVLYEISKKAPPTTVGRPRLPFSAKSDFGKRKEAADLSAEKADTNLLVRAAATSARTQGDTDLAAVLKESMESPTRPSKMRKFVNEDPKKPIPYSADEALAFLLEHNFSKEQYNAIRDGSKKRNSDIYPHYNKIAAAKLKCRPEGIEASETLAKVPLRNILQHTAEKIVDMQREVFQAVMEAEKTNFVSSELILSYGFDSSTGQAQFKQAFNEPGSSNSSDSSLLATTVIPLRLLLSSGKPIWNNRTPQSVRFCRPIKLEYIKETKEVVLKEHLKLKNEINALKTLTISIGDGKSVEVSFKLFLTLIDGKVLNIITGTRSNQACSICGATPKDFMNTSNYKSEVFHAKEETLKFGISPLHCWIRFFEFLLHLGYKCKIQKWQIRGEDKLPVLKRKVDIQNDFWKKLGLRVDMPRVGGSGSTNDGNTARRAFTEHTIFSKITDVDEDLIFRFKIILSCLSCEFEINSSKFEIYCFQTAKRFQELYPWLPMSSTVHKVLIHSREIIENTALPMGFFGEQAAESRHQIYKADRLHHARRNNRTNNLLDIFNRAIDTSDPLISTFFLSKRIQKRKRITLPPEVIELLCCSEPLEDFQLNNQDDEINETEEELFNLNLHNELDLCD
ncbi:uncharacterized protein LOC125776435 [Bactrocera dorsalis]|uniref:Uncharacterized protein LOC125776435 n=1 Tax=Bactrocera dorsalis TaxID=27457 RepID=A0ABM3J4V1_BACDO|nr:uncharacterized protein LOC125776435 [Bactrocera dorsalis]